MRALRVALSCSLLVLGINLSLEPKVPRWIAAGVLGAFVGSLYFREDR